MAASFPEENYPQIPTGPVKMEAEVSTSQVKMKAGDDDDNDEIALSSLSLKNPLTVYQLIEAIPDLCSETGVTIQINRDIGVVSWFDSEQAVQRINVADHFENCEIK